MTTLPNVSCDVDGLLDDARQVNVGGGTREEINYIKLEKDKTIIVRILPPPVHSEYKRVKAALKIKKHFGFMNSKGNPAPIICSTEQYGSCPICDTYIALRAGSVEEKQRASKIKPQERFIFTVLDINNKFGILEIDAKCLKSIASIVEAQKSMNPTFNPFHLQDGHWLSVTKRKDTVKKGNFQENIYMVSFDMKSKAVPDDVLASYDQLYVWPEKNNRVFKPEEIQQAMDGKWDFLKNYFNSEDLSFPPKEEPQTTNKYQGFKNPIQPPKPEVTASQLDDQMQKDMMSSLLDD